MSEKNELNLLDARIREHYDAMPPSEKCLADLLLCFPGNIADYSATELCELANTSKAAASRFFHRLGYKDFNDARRQTREAKRWGAPLYQSNLGTKPKGENRSHLIAQHLEREMTNLQRTLESIETDTLHSLVKAIVSKRRVAIIGYRNSRFLAGYLHRQLSLLRPNVSLHPSASQAMAEELFDLGDEDLLVIIGMRRRTPILKKIIEHADQVGTKFALIADPTAATIEKKASWKISCILHSTSAFDSYSSAMSVLTLLVNCVLNESEEGYERLRKIELVHEKFGELTDNGVHARHPAKI